jgi:hypothetical protein
MMKKYMPELENLQALTESEWVRYRQAIVENKPFEEAKVIYLHIKELKTQITELTNKIRDQLIWVIKLPLEKRFMWT